MVGLDAVDRLTPAEQEALAAGRTIMGGGGMTVPSAQAVALRSLELGDGPQGPGGGTLATADPASAAVLLRQAALVVALSTRVGQLGPAEVRSALRDLFEEEEGYWRRAASEVIAPGQPTPALRAALAASAVVGTDGLADAATVLRRVPALAVGAADRLARLAVWWHGLYARVGDAARADAPAARLARRSAARRHRQHRHLLDRRGAGRRTPGHLDPGPAGPGRAPRRLAAGARATHDRSEHQGRRRGRRGRVRLAAPPVSAAAPVDEALAWLTQELELDQDDLEALGEAISYPTRSLSRTAIVLARRLLDGADTDEDRAAFLLSLGARYSELGRWSEARQHTELAVETLRQLAELRPRPVPARPGRGRVQSRLLPGPARRTRTRR